MVERNNRGLGDSLRALLLDRGQDEWDSVLPQIMRALRGTPHSVMGETPNFMLLGRQLRLPDQLLNAPPTSWAPQNEYVLDTKERLDKARGLLNDKQVKTRQEDHEEPPLFAPGDLVWLENRRKTPNFRPSLYDLMRW